MAMVMVSASSTISAGENSTASARRNSSVKDLGSVMRTSAKAMASLWRSGRALSW
jgi:hypothetical protein